MSLLRKRSLPAALAVLLLLGGCATAPPAAGVAENRYHDRVNALAEFRHWTLSGRLALRDGDEGGSGNLNWQQAPGFTRMDFHGALGRGAWRLTAAPGVAGLELADGATYQAESVDALVRRELGWRIPVDDLAWWVRGLEAPGLVEARHLDENGNLLALTQRGWSIEYGRYRDVGGVTLPVKMTARRAAQSVKLAVREWSLDDPDG